jgi:hypothetical protein
MINPPGKKAGSHLSLADPREWNPKSISEIRGLFHYNETSWCIRVHHCSKDKSYCEIVPKKKSLKPLIKQWMLARDQICSSLIPIAGTQRTMIKEKKVYVSSGALPNYDCCIEPVIALYHSSDVHSSHLGDCWLVKFCSSGNTMFIPTNELYLQQETNLLAFPIAANLSND